MPDKKLYKSFCPVILMRKHLSLLVIFIISIAGLLFSGYLSYQELIQKTCPLGGCSNLFGFPVCVYGFIMYLAIFLVSLFGLRGRY
jgi:uncharacterized membrane protein